MAIKSKTAATLLGTVLSVLAAACSGGGTSQQAAPPSAAGVSASLATLTSSTPPPSSSALSVTRTPTNSNVPSATPSSPATATPPQGGPSGVCKSSQLRLTSGPRQGAAGSAYTTFSLTNVGQQACVLQGYPGVSVLDPAGNLVGQPADRYGPVGHPIEVAPGGRAQFVLRISEVTQPGCAAPRPSTEVQVYPPDQTVPLIIPFDTVSCVLRVAAITQ